MRIGIMSGSGEEDDASFAALLDYSQRIETAGFDSLWLNNGFSYEAFSVLTAIGYQTTRLELGTAVTLIHTRHPLVMAQQALTASEASAGRFTLGVGPSNKHVIENMLGLSHAKPASHMSEYLTVLAPLLRGEAVAHSGDHYTINAGLNVEAAPTPSVFVGAIGTRMLQIAGSLADGVTTWMVGPKTVREVIAPAVGAAAERADRPAPRIVCGVPVVHTNDVEATRAIINERMAFASNLPSYRAALDREGADGPADICLIGDEETIAAGLANWRDAGATDFVAAIKAIGPESYERTFQALAAQPALSDS